MPVEFSAFGLIAAQAEERVQMQLEKVALDVEAEAKRGAPHWMNHLAGSIEAGPGVTPHQRRVNVAAEYGAAVEYGARPHWLPKAVIEGDLAKWARDHGMPGAEHAIAAKIARVGTPAQPFLNPAVEHVRASIPFNIQQIIGVSRG